MHLGSRKKLDCDLKLPNSYRAQIDAFLSKGYICLFVLFSDFPFGLWHNFKSRSFVRLGVVNLAD